MDELKILVWIVIGLVYLFARKKKKPVAPTPTRSVESYDEYRTPAFPSKPMTFEDLLKEIEGSKKPEFIPKPIPESVYEVPSVNNYDEKIVEKKPLEDTNYDYRKHDTIYETYDNATKYAFVKPSLEETMRLEDTIMRFKPFKEYELDPKQKFRKDLLNELKNPQSFKKAFIMSEILQRKF